MATIILADDGSPYDGNSIQQGPLGGAETAFVKLAEALAEIGNEVTVFNNCKNSVLVNNVLWKNLKSKKPLTCDLFIANRAHSVISLIPKAKKRVFWIHNPANYLIKWRYLSRLWWWKPIIIFSSNFQAKSYPDWAPASRRVRIPYGISHEFLSTPKLTSPPKPKAIFTSSPLRSLDWLLDIWSTKIYPKVPNAELHLFSSPKTYGDFGRKKKVAMNDVLKKAYSLKKFGVVVNDVLPKALLAKVLSGSRVLLYKGDLGETYCLALGESQACGVPAVIQNIGCVAERIIDKKTGFVAPNDEIFAKQAVKILNDDKLWRSMHNNAIKYQRSWTWLDAAKEFEKLIV